MAKKLDVSPEELTKYKTGLELYGIYALVRVGTGLPKVLLMTKEGDWTQSLDAAGAWESRSEVESVLSKTTDPGNCKNLWWFTWFSDAVPCELTKN
jgi:hypothetical protein